MTHYRHWVPGLALLLGSLTLHAQTEPTLTPYTPLTKWGRLDWAVDSTIGYPNLAGGLFSSALGTARNRPPEYGPHWEGYGKRYAMRLTGSVTSNFMEATAGAFIGEDPRYFRAGREKSPGARIGYAVKSAFLAHNRDGKTVPAYARYGAFAGSNYLSNQWRAAGESKTSDATIRIGFAFMGRAIGNTFTEFWPDIKAAILRH